MAVTEKKQALLTGIGDLVLCSITNAAALNSTTAPTYNEEVYRVPSLQKMATSLTVTNKKVRLSNKIHSNVSSVKDAELTIDAAYLPEGFVEEHTGMAKLFDGAWVMGTSPKKKPFRCGIPLTDENGKISKVTNFPYCFLVPADMNGETVGEDFNEQISQFKIEALPLPYLTAEGQNPVYLTVDFENTKASEHIDPTKLLEKGWYDKKTLQQCNVESKTID